MDKPQEYKDSAVIIGCDASQYWLLPWWLYHFRRTNPTCPVEFFGQDIPEVVYELLHRNQVQVRLIPTSDNTASWKSWWYMKPSALRRAEARRVLWVDLDCQVLASVAPLFSVGETETEPYLGLRRDLPAEKYWSRNLCEGERNYNSGVIATLRDHPILEIWQDAIQLGQGWFHGDQDILSRLLFLDPSTLVIELPKELHTLRWEVHEDKKDLATAKLLHWTGPGGKEGIKNQLNALRAAGQIR